MARTKNIARKRAKGKQFKSSPTTAEDSTSPVDLLIQDKRFSKKQEKRNLKKQLLQGNLRDNGPSRSPSKSSKAPMTSVYRRPPKYPLSFTKPLDPPVTGFVSETHPIFNEILCESYEGFAIENTECFEESFHEKFQRALKDLESEGYYQFDMTQPAGLGTKVTIE